MMRTLLRWLVGRYGRAIGVVFAVAAAWGYWWLWPASPLRELRFEQIADQGLELADGGKKLIVFGQSQKLPPESKQRLRPDSFRIIDLATLREVLDTTSIVASRLSNDGKLLAIVCPDFSIQVISAGDGQRLLTIPSDGSGNIPKLVAIYGDGLLIVTRKRQNHVVNEFWRVDKASKTWETPIANLVFSPHHRYCSWLKDGSLVVVESASGREIARTSDSAICTAAGWAVHPNGEELAIAAPSNGSKSYCVTTVSLPDFATKKSFEFKAMTHTCPIPTYSATGRFLTVGTGEGSLWDWSDEKPRILDPTTWNNDYFALVASDDRHYILSRDRIDQAWHFCRTGESEPKLSGYDSEGTAPVFSPSGRLLMVPRSFDHRASVIWLRQQLHARLGIRLFRTTATYSVIDVDQARIIASFPLHYGARGFGPGETTFWTSQGEIDQSTGKLNETIRQYSTLPASPPWWLYLVTFASVAFIYWGFRRAKPAKEAAKLR